MLAVNMVSLPLNVSVPHTLPESAVKMAKTVFSLKKRAILQLQVRERVGIQQISYGWQSYGSNHNRTHKHRMAAEEPAAVAPAADPVAEVEIDPSILSACTYLIS